MARTLTDDDIAAISVAVAEHQVCALGLNKEDAAIIKNHLGLYKKARNIVGTVVLTAIAVLLVGIFSKGFWTSLIEGMKK